MKNNKIADCSSKERHFAQIPINTIVVVNSRRRDEDRFKETVRSIKEVGLQKPILVNARNFKKKGVYELVCGEGRLEAHKQLGKTYIEAEIINADDEYTLLAGLAENLTRSKKDVIDFARRILEMHRRGMSYSDLARITGKSSTTIADYIGLMEKGEECLIRAIEEERISISFAMEVIENPEKEVQKFLMEARLNGDISNRDLGCITKILKDRARKNISNANMTITKLQSIIKEKTKQHKLLCTQGELKRNDAIRLGECLKSLLEDKKLCEMIVALKLPRPELSEQYGI